MRRSRAASCGDARALPMVDMLIGKGANVNSRARNHTTPLHTAVLYARLDAARLLLDNGAELNAKSAAGATPPALAEAARNQPIAELLRSYGAR
jgi:ankyrin repeat protein